MHFQDTPLKVVWGTFNYCVVGWCWAGMDSSFCELLFDTRLTLVVDRGVAVIPSACCLFICLIIDRLAV